MSEDLGRSYTKPDQLPNLELADVEAALQELPEEQRTTLILVALEDMSYEEAARITNVCIGTIRSRLSRGRRALLAKVEGVEKTRMRQKLRGVLLRRRGKPRDAMIRHVAPKSVRSHADHRLSDGASD